MQTTLVDELRAKRELIHAIAARHGVISIRVFGSVVRNEATPTSDIDLLVETGANTSPWFPAGLVLDLERVLGRHVDVVTERGLHPALRSRVLHEAQLICG